MTIRSICLLGAWLTLAASPAAAQDVRYTTSSIRLRAEATVESAVVTSVPLGSRVEVRACAVQWCWVEYGSKTGYVSERYLGRAPHRIAKGNKRYVNSKQNRVPSPLMSASGPPAGASARCRDGTYSFSRSRSGTCSHHGGVGRWL